MKKGHLANFMQGQDPLNNEVCLKKIEEAVKLIDERKFQSYAKLAEELFFDASKPEVRRSMNAQTELNQVNVREWTNIPFPLCDAIENIIQCANLLDAKSGKGTKVLQDIIHLNVFNTEVLEGRIEE